MSNVDPLWNEIGPPGKDGEPGKNGLDGKPGIGRDGNDGASIEPAGEWMASKTYRRLALVTYENDSYIASAESKGRVPSTRSRFWQLVAKSIRGPRGLEGGPGQRGRAYPAFLIEQRVQDLEVAIQSTGTSSVSAVFNEAVSRGMAIRIDDDSIAHLAIGHVIDVPPAVRYWACDGLALGDVAAGGTGSYATDGIVELSDWSAVTGAVHLSPGSQYILSQTEPGKLDKYDVDAFYLIKQVIGTALNTTQLDIEIETARYSNGWQAEFDSECSRGAFVYVTSGVFPHQHVDRARADDLATATAVGITQKNFGAGHIGEFLIHGHLIAFDKDWTVSTGAAELGAGD